MITLNVNGEAITLAADATLAELLVQLACDKAVVTAVNDTFVPRNGHSAHRLCDGDRVELLSPMEGG